MKFRNEYDSLGSIKVPQDKYWGASTERSKKHFDIGDFLVRPIVIKSIAMIKKAAAIVNTKDRILDKKIRNLTISFLRCFTNNNTLTATQSIFFNDNWIPWFWFPPIS